MNDKNGQNSHANNTKAAFSGIQLSANRTIKRTCETF